MLSSPNESEEEMFINPTVEGDAAKVLMRLPEGRVDLVVTDPP